MSIEYLAFLYWAFLAVAITSVIAGQLFLRWIIQNIFHRNADIFIENYGTTFDCIGIVFECVAIALWVACFSIRHDWSSGNYLLLLLLVINLLLTLLRINTRYLKLYKKSKDRKETFINSKASVSF